MPILKILPHASLCPAGLALDVERGTNLCRALLDHGVAIEHACELSCACTTCHIVVKQGFNSLKASDESEDDLLDRAWGLTAVSRLSCQTVMANQDLTIEIPKYSINHAREEH